MAKIFISFFEISVSISLVVAAMVLLTSLLNKRYAAKWKYLIWIFLALRLLIPVKGTDIGSVMNILSRMKNHNAEAGNSQTAALADAAAPGRVIVAIPQQMTTPIAVQSERSIGITLLDIVALIWAAGCLTIISVHLFSYFHYKGQVMKRGTIIKDTRILCRMSELKRELHIKGVVHAIEYTEAGSPMIIGFIKPVLVLPKEQYSKEELFFILKHELVHLKRGDVYFKLLFASAAAVHWFNPLIWIMQKEATVDMELSCDERVTQGTNFAVRKAYTETLLSMLHRRCTRKTVLSTQFYGGKNIMKKRFKNILIRKGKKNGISILLCAIIITISLGTLVGCQAVYESKENAENASAQSGNEIGNENAESGSLADRLGADPGASDDTLRGMGMSYINEAETPEIRANTTALTFYKEGIAEEKQAELMVGDGYSIYLPENEWQRMDTDIWTAVLNERVSLWIAHYEDTSVSEREEELVENGYVTMEEDHKLQKQEGGLINNVELKEYGNDVWGIFYCYPVEAEEGWGRELIVITETFAVSAAADGGLVQNLNGNGGSDNSVAHLGEAERQEIRNIVDEFAAAYFGGNADGIKKYLVSTYEWGVDTYEGSGTISDMTLKGLSDADEHRTASGTYIVSLEYMDSEIGDSFRYLTFEFVRQEDGWKVQFYGLEG